MTAFYGEHSKVWLSVDCIIFGFDEGKLKILIGKRKMDPGRGEWSLYGGFVNADESVDDAASRTLYELTGLRNLYMRQVGAFGNVDRDPGERVVSIAYYALINVNDYDDALRQAHGVEWIDINEIPQLYSDHNDMVLKARKMMKQGATVWLYQPGFHHSKIMMVDGRFCTVGSTNLDSRSLRYDYEENAVIIDRNTTKELDDMFTRDKQESIQLTPEYWKEFRTPWQRFRGWFAHLLSPFL